MTEQPTTEETTTMNTEATEATEAICDSCDALTAHPVFYDRLVLCEDCA